MAKQVQFRRGSTSQHSTFTGAVGEVTVDTDKDVVVVHDGSTAGGFPLARQLSDLGVTSTSAELNILDGATLTTAELNYVDGVTSAIQTQLDAKGTVSSLSDLGITATATELNYVDGVTSNIQTQLDAKGTVSSLSDLSITASAAELNILDGVTATTAELNYVDGVTSNIQTQLNNAASTGKAIAMAIVFG